MANQPKARFRCGQCEMFEERCTCDKFCCMCQSQIDVRLCGDGLFYCQPCREACDYKSEDQAAAAAARH